MAASASLTDQFNNATSRLITLAQSGGNPSNAAAMKQNLAELKAAADALSALLATKIATL